MSTPNVSAEPAPPSPAQSARRSGFATLGARLTTDAARSQLLALSLALTCGVVVFVRFVALDWVPVEWYGDISTVYEYVLTVRAGRILPGIYALGIGPLYPAVLSPMLQVFGTSYLSVKASAAIVSLVGLGLLFALARTMIDTRFAILATFIAGVGSWLLVYSRLGDVQALVPTLTMATLWLVVVMARSKRFNPIAAIACGLLASSGLYLYGAAFALPAIAGLMGFVYLLARRLSLANFALLAAALAIGALPLIVTVLGNPQGFATGHFGSKLGSPETALANLPGNFASAMLAYVSRGDSIHRANPPYVPHIDPISLALAIIGVIFWLSPGRRTWGALLLVSFFVLHVPSMLVSPGEVPNAGRTIGAAPVVYLLVAGGLWWLGGIAAKWTRPVVAILGVCIVVGLITAVNLQRYFVDYVNGVPFGNAPVAPRIVDYVDLLPKDTTVFMLGSTWINGLPEPKSIRYVMRNPTVFQEIWPEAQMTCDRLGSLTAPAVLIWNPAVDVPHPGLQACRDLIPSQVFVSDNGVPIFRAASVRRAVR